MLTDGWLSFKTLSGKYKQDSVSMGATTLCDVEHAVLQQHHVTYEHTCMGGKGWEYHIYLYLLMKFQFHVVGQGPLIKLRNFTS